MYPFRSRILVCLIAIAMASPAAGQASVRFSDLAGWWSADPEWGGESSHLALQFLEKDGKQEAHLSIPAIGGYDINLGTIVLTGNALTTQGLAFPLTWNPESKTLSGFLPADAAPVYNIPIEFKRGGTLEATCATRVEGAAADGAMVGRDGRAGMGRAGAGGGRHTVRR